MKVRYLRGTVLEELRASVAGNLNLYRSGSFNHLFADPSKYFEGTFDADEERLSSLRLPDADEFYEEDNCAACYGALSDLTPYDARDERLWAYLTHTLMLRYTRQRWPVPDDDKIAMSHILRHFFAKDKRQIERDNAASRLWWMARLCQRVTDLPLEDCLQVLLYKSDVRANIIERPTASQSSEVFSAIMKKLHASYQGDKRLFERSAFRPFMRRINSIGGVKLLDCMSEQQLVALLGRVIEHDLGFVAL